MHRISLKSSKRIDSDFCCSIMPFINQNGLVGQQKFIKVRVWQEKLTFGRVYLIGLTGYHICKKYSCLFLWQLLLSLTPNGCNVLIINLLPFFVSIYKGS